MWKQKFFKLYLVYNVTTKLQAATLRARNWYLLQCAVLRFGMKCGYEYYFSTCTNCKETFTSSSQFLPFYTLPAAPQTYPLHRYTLYIHRSNHSLSLLSLFAYYLMFICSFRTKEHVLQCISGGDKNNSSVTLFHITWHMYNCSPIGQQNVSSSANCILIDTALSDQTATDKQVWVIRVISHVKRNYTYLSKYKDIKYLNRRQNVV